MLIWVLNIHANMGPMSKSLKKNVWVVLFPEWMLTWVWPRTCWGRNGRIITVYTSYNICRVFPPGHSALPSVSRFWIWKPTHVWNLGDRPWLLIGVSPASLVSLIVQIKQCSHWLSLLPLEMPSFTNHLLGSLRVQSFWLHCRLVIHYDNYTQGQREVVL